MRAVQLDFADRKFPASLVDIPEPDLPGDDWARVRVDVGGICGSDLHIFTGNIGPSPTIVGFTPFPFLLGHEIGGTVIDAGDRAGIDVGTRVVVQPTITCEARGIDPPCPSCARGDMAACQRLDSQVATVGMALGFTDNLGGGWAEQVVAHRSMLFPLPDSIPDRAASLHEPLSIAAHGLLRRPPEDGTPIAVVGAGVIGLATLAAIRVMFPKSAVTIIARHAHQEEAARRCGATNVVRAEGAALFEALAAIVGSRPIGNGDDLMLAEGFGFVVEAVGSSSAVNDAFRMTNHRGTVVLLGASATGTYDLTSVWWRELHVVGAINHSWDTGPGGHRHSEQRALDILASGGFPHEVIVTHEFPLEDLRDAVSVAADRASGAIKVVFRPNSA